MALNPPEACNIELSHVIQKSLPIPQLSESELDGLNLNITVPKLLRKEPIQERKLPVFVWVHGGGYMLGANSWPHYDQARFVKLSSEIGLPVIGVGIK